MTPTELRCILFAFIRVIPWIAIALLNEHP